jgi:glycosyltransferase involved in cell wall biosynthesis
MIRVLHLCPARRDFETQSSLDHLIRDLGAEYCSSILRIGSDREPLSVPIGALTIQFRRGVTPDIVHAWGATALSAALLGRCGRVIYSPLPAERPLCRGRLAAMSRSAGARVVCTSETSRRRFLDIGISPDRCHTIRPGVDTSRVQPARNSALRTELGFEDSDEVILAPGETIRGSGHREAAWAMGILNVMDRRRRLLIWGRGEGVDTLRNFTERLQQPNLLTVAEQKLRRPIEFEELPTVADVALAASNGRAAILPLGICMARGLPVVSTDNPDAAELLEDGRTALLRPRATPMMLAQCVLDLEKDSAMRRRLSEGSRAVAIQAFSLPGYLAQWRAVYAAVAAGRQIEQGAIAV